MANYPKTDRSSFLNRGNLLTKDEIKISKQFGREYFDGERKFGLGGYKYDSKYFKPVVKNIIDHYGINNNSSLLDVGCAKGFLLYDLKSALPDITVAGLDISSYCIENSIPEIKQYLKIGSCDKLPWPDNSFDYVISIATIHNLDIKGVQKSLEEIVRVAKLGAFIKVNGYSNEEERIRLEHWNIVANTILHVDEWLQLFKKTNYVYDYDFFIP